MIFMLSINMMLSMTFIFLNHPMTMGLNLLMQTIIIALITGMLNSNFWFSYILFLIMIGGMLVLFIYMTSIASNEMFNYSSKILLLIMMTFLISLTLILLMDNFFLNSTFNFNNNLINMNLFNYSINKFFNYPSIFIIFFMIIYLFISLIAIVKITKIEYGPLRQKF